MSGFTVKFILVFVLLSTLLSSCVEFKQMTLYTGEEVSAPLVKPDNIKLLVEPEIFDEDFSDVWGIETIDCKSAEISEKVTAEGDVAIKIEWDRNEQGCVWAGFGIGWDGYAGKDLSELIPFAAIQFQVRTVKGKRFGLPVVLTLEDYSGGMGFAYTGNKYFERTSIDEDWQKVTVPLSAFDMDIENLDPTNIKQLMFELQQSGALYFDDVKLVMYEAPVIEPWHIEKARADPTKFPITLFDDTFINNNGWGLMQDECRDIKIENETITTEWNAQDNCGAIQMGISWNKWFPIDMRSIDKDAHLQLSLKPTSGSTPGDILVHLQDYSGATSKNRAVLSASGGNSIVQVSLNLLLEGINASNVKQVLFTFEGEGAVEIDDIELLEILP